jgi:hypothetical protein
MHKNTPEISEHSLRQDISQRIGKGLKILFIPGPAFLVKINCQTAVRNKCCMDVRMKNESRVTMPLLLLRFQKLQTAGLMGLLMLSARTSTVLEWSSALEICVNAVNESVDLTWSHPLCS